MGIPKTLKRNSLPYTFSLALSLKGKEKVYTRQDMGIKKAHRLKNRTKNKVLTLQERAFKFISSFTLPLPTGYKQARDNMMIIRSLHESNSTGEFFIMNLSKDDMLLLSKGLESLAKNPMDFNPKRIRKMIRSFNDPNCVVDNENIYPLYAKKDDIHNGHSFVDLGLPSGLKWATCNVGATSPEQAGLYFAWGETVGYTLEQVNSGERAFIPEDYDAGPAASISTDLTLAQDAADVNLGGNWRMPAKAEDQELLDNCDVTWTNDYNGTGIKGSIFTSKVNGKSVFFPAAGYCDDSFVSDVGSNGDYWSASWDSSSYAWRLDFYSGSQDLLNYSRYYGFSVRGVCERV